MQKTKVKPVSVILKILFVLEQTKIVSYELVTPNGDGTSHNVDTFPVSKLIGENRLVINTI